MAGTLFAWKFTEMSEFRIVTILPSTSNDNPYFLVTSWPYNCSRRTLKTYLVLCP